MERKWESAPYRTWRDAKTWLLSSLVAWIVVAVVFGMVGALFVPVENRILWRLLYGGLGAIVALILIFGVTYLVFSARTPYRQRDEARALLATKPKPVSLPNRNDLLRAIAEVQHTSGRVLMAQEQLDSLVDTSPHIISTDALSNRDNAHDRYEQAMKSLYGEKLVAGDPFNVILSDLITYISTQVWLKEAKPEIIGGDPKQFQIRTALEIIGKIGGKVIETISEINKITREGQ